MAKWINSGLGRGVVSCDWFALSCILGAPRGDRPLEPPAGCSVVRMAATAVWADRFFILDADGNKVATVLCSPRTPKMDSRRALIEIANRWLYHDNFHEVVDGVLNCLPMTVTGLNRVDLCCDFEMDSKLWSTYSKLAAGTAYVKSLQEGLVWWHNTNVVSSSNRVERIPHCLNWGGKESLVRWKIYWKWLDLQQADPENKKPYINDLWQQMGFVERSVWRCEVSIHGTNKLADGMGQRVQPMAWYDDRVRLWSDLYADKFVVRLNQGHKDKRNDTVLPFLEVVGGKSLWHALPRAERDESDPERRMVCKIWSELCKIDVQANRGLFDSLRGVLGSLCERASNVHALQTSFGVGVNDIADMLQQ